MGLAKFFFIIVVPGTNIGYSEMKRVLILLLSSLLFSSFSLGQTIEHHYVQVGNSLTFTDTNNTWDITETNIRDYVRFSNSGSKFTITGLVVGTVPFYTAQKNGSTMTKQTIHMIHVVDVQDIILPVSLDLKIGENFTFTPLITPLNTSTTLTWVSNNETVVTIDANGTVTATGIGKATIICTATNGIKAQSLVTVSPLLAQSITLNRKTCDLSVGESVQLQYTILPQKVTTSDVKWLTSNENIAQVDDEGNVTAISSGYCSIFAIADDGSSKFDKCLFHVSGNTKKGDVNEDGDVDVTDIVTVANIILRGNISQ